MGAADWDRVETYPNWYTSMAQGIQNFLRGCARAAQLRLEHEAAAR